MQIIYMHYARHIICIYYTIVYYTYTINILYIY